jgi:hypothetical protein
MTASTRLFVSGTTLMLALVVARGARAQEAPLRDLSTDRPDTTESAHTVDAGHFQAEIDVVRATRDARQNEYSYLSSNLKMGLTSFWDVQLVVDSLVGVPTDRGHDYGVGDLTLRTKFNFVGNDEGAFVFATMPWVKFPTSGPRGNGAVDTGLILAFGVDVPLDFSLTWMAEADLVKNDAAPGRHGELLTSASLGHAVVGDLAAFVEFAGTYSSEDGAGYAAVIDGGPVWGVTPWLQVDCGVGFGLTDAAEDFTSFAGVSFKL